MSWGRGRRRRIPASAGIKKQIYLFAPFELMLTSFSMLPWRLLHFLIYGSFCFVIVPLFPGLVTVDAFTGTYGINYGRIADNIPQPESVVTLLKAAKIKNVRIFDADHSVLKAFKGAGLELVVGLPNGFLKDMSTNEDHAMDWVKENVQPFYLTHILRQSLTLLTHRLQVLFKEDVLVYLKPILDFFSKTGAPFCINVYPFLAYDFDPDHIDVNYALFESNSGIYDEKTDLHYDNMFDAQIDAAYAALEVVGFDKMEVIVTETGWASGGGGDEKGASPENARTYNYNLRKRLFKRKGTPLRPKIVTKAYIFALFNEDLKPGQGSERHFGLFKADGSISYDIGFSGLKSSPAPPSSISLKDIQVKGWLAPYSLIFVTCTSILLLVLA
ncbi:hypothetical protein J5N97_026636 [Dioscorea zingiberensis]|uniref:Glucan endo-1,3-beta-D-glucosidase n=1 Tax=Dioscorea zingiberensis TaxID=325984 RepID=A0A9D5C3B3_9LILI|nr:hypothetical protein J5N97_026636 [Dioscorea zingiberensis]